MPKITFHGQSCFEIEGTKGKIIIDPFLSDNPVAKIKPEELKDIKAILVTHGHKDHFGDTMKIARNCLAQVIAPAELARYLIARGIDAHRMHIGGSHRFDWGWVKLTQALHGSGFESGDTIIYMGSPCGFFLDIDGILIYHAGDTGLFGDMKIFKDLLGGRTIDLAMLPIGDNFVMGPDDALTAVKWIEPKNAIPMHYNTFPLIIQDGGLFKINVEKETSSKVIVLEPGESVEM